MRLRSRGLDLSDPAAQDGWVSTGLEESPVAVELPVALAECRIGPGPLGD